MLSKNKIEDLIDLQKKIFIAYSGGPDSTALIHIFANLMSSNKLNVEAIHVNHNLSKDSKKWEKHCNEQLASVGFEPVTNWPSCFFHRRLKLLLTVYVDDFKLAGQKGNLNRGLSLIRDTAGLNIEDPAPAHKPPQASGGDRTIIDSTQGFCGRRSFNVDFPGGFVVPRLSPRIT